MCNVALIAIALLSHLLPTLIGDGLTKESAYNFIYLTDQVTIIFLSYYIFRKVTFKAAWQLLTSKTSTWQKPIVKVISFILLIVSLWFLINYLMTEVSPTSGIFNYVSGKEHG